MNLISKHADTVVVLSAMFAAFLWMNNKFNTIEKDISVIKTVMIMNGHFPKELAIVDVQKMEK